jgi:hypothetical protein
MNEEASVKSHFFTALLVLILAMASSCKSTDSQNLSALSFDRYYHDNRAYVHEFRASPWQVIPGQPVTLFWNISGAKTVHIEGVIGPTEQRHGSIVVYPTQTTTYHLLAYSAEGYLTERFAEVRIETAPGDPAISYFQAAEPAVIKGRSTTLHWQVFGCSRLEIQSPQLGVISRECRIGLDSLVITPDETNFYEIRLYNSRNQIVATDFTKVEVIPEAKTPIVNSFTTSAHNNEINEGETVIMYWNVSNARRVSIPSHPSFSGQQTDNLPAYGEITLRPTEDTTYTLYAEGENGGPTITATLRITVRSIPKITAFYAEPTVIDLGASTTVKWNVINCTSAQLTGARTGAVPCNGSRTVSPKQTTKFQLVAKGRFGNTESAEFTVVVNQPAQKASIIGFSASRPAIVEGESVILSWEVKDARWLNVEGANLGSSVPAVHKVEVRPKAPQTEYRLKAYGTNPNTPDAEALITINVVPPRPAIQSFTSNVASIVAGGEAELSWQATGGCWMVAIINTTTEQSGCSGRITVRPTETTTYKLVVFGKDGGPTVDSTVTLRVVKPLSNDEALDILLKRMRGEG